MTRKTSNRVKFASTLKEDLYEELQKLSEDTGIPISKLFDKAVEGMLIDLGRLITMDGLE